MIAVYKITSPSGRIYIGSSKNIKKRFQAYKMLNCKAQKKLYQSLKKYGYNNHKFEIIEECTIDILLKKEYEYGIFYNVLNPKKGLNLILPKIDDVYNHISDELINTMKKAQQNRKPISEEARKRMSDAHKGKKQSKETIEKRLGHRRGKSLSPEAKRSGAKITVEKVIEIKKLLQEFKSAYKVHRVLSDPNVSLSIVVNIAYNRSWKHIKI